MEQNFVELGNGTYLIKFWVSHMGTASIDVFALDDGRRVSLKDFPKTINIGPVTKCDQSKYLLPESSGLTCICQAGRGIPIGTIMSSSSPACTFCARGKYKRYDSTSGPCQTCSAGYFASDEGWTQPCDACGPGRYSSAGASFCSA